MKNKLALLFFLFALSFDGLVSRTIGASPAPALSNTSRAVDLSLLPLLNNRALEFFFAALNPDGINRVAQHRRKHRQQKHQRKAKVYGIKVSPGEAGAPPPTPEPEERPTMAAPPPPPVEASPETGVPGRGRSSSPAKKSAPRIKPPTVMIKPPTE